MKKKDIVGSILWGVAFIAGGTLLLLDQLEIIEFNLGQWWPAIFIVIGINIILSSLFKD